MYPGHMYEYSIRVGVHCITVDRIKAEADGWTDRFAIAIVVTKVMG